jgi:hypothetical protein
MKPKRQENRNLIPVGMIHCDDEVDSLWWDECGVRSDNTVSFRRPSLLLLSAALRAPSGPRVRVLQQERYNSRSMPDKLTKTLPPASALRRIARDEVLLSR